ncbi:MAG: hypothetical protein IPJ06_05385 [Saprospiraceae bacterium]|nr:hypothetical protein [Saprospiraceae bacterium]
MVDGTCRDSYTLTRRWTATDNCGNTAADQVISIGDALPPVSKVQHQLTSL